MSNSAPTWKNSRGQRFYGSKRARRVLIIGPLVLFGCLLLVVQHIMLLSRLSSWDEEKAAGQSGANVASNETTTTSSDSTSTSRAQKPTTRGQWAATPTLSTFEMGDIRVPSDSSKYSTQRMQDVEGEEVSPKPIIDMKPLLTCRSRRGDSNFTSDKSSPIMRKKKLAFVHIFKTAGSTMRGFFDRYSSRCGLGWAVVVSCTSADAQSVLHTNTTWKKRDKKGKCHLKRWTRADDGRRFDGLEGDSARFDGNFLRENVDIVGGHLPLGVVDHVWSHEAGIDLRYVAFFRDALHKYVSGRIYSNTKNQTGLTLNYFLDLIKDEVTRHLARGYYYRGYYNYLLTPEQVERLGITHHFKNMTTEERTRERVRMVKQNIVEYNVICGITERMPQSLEILHYLIDPNDSARDIFEQFGMPYENGTLPPVYVSNASKEVTTSTVLEELEKDPVFFANLKEFVKYEQQVTDFAINMHGKQYESMKRKTGSLQD